MFGSSPTRTTTRGTSSGPARSPSRLRLQARRGPDMLPRTVAMAILLAFSGSLRAGTVCALVDPEATPRAALLEARLLAAPGIQWVERTNIEAVLREQQLQAAFGPQGVADRVRLGKLAKADLLIL